MQFLPFFVFSLHLTHDLGSGQETLFQTDFLKLVGCSFRNLQAAGVENTLYFLVKSIGELRSDGSSRRMPLDPHAFWVLFIITSNFFAKGNATNIHPLWPTMQSGKTTMFCSLWSQVGTSCSVAQCGAMMVSLQKTKISICRKPLNPKLRFQPRIYWLL